MSPSLPTLYFSTLNVASPGVGDTSTKTPSSSSSSLQIPSEIVHKCLAEYSDWGDLAKLACVQKSWSNILNDAAGLQQVVEKNNTKNSVVGDSNTTKISTASSSSSCWELAQAFMNGTHGLSINPQQGIRVLHQIAGSTQPPSTMTKNSSETKNNNKNDDVADDDDNHAPAAMKELASCYWNGNGVDVNAEIGLAWMVSAYDACGDVDAAYQVAMVYEYGRHDVETDVVAAAQWFQKGAKSGHIESMTELALCYELGCGLEQSDELALEWYMLAANLGHVSAQYSVAEIFEEARGVPQSDEEACLWYYRAAMKGDEDSRKALLRLRDIARIILPGGGLNRILNNLNA